MEGCGPPNKGTQSHSQRPEKKGHVPMTGQSKTSDEKPAYPLIDVLYKKKNRKCRKMGFESGFDASFSDL